MGIASVVVYSEADADSLAVAMADETVFIGPSPANQSYLVAEKILDAAKSTGAEAIHPGFGFLSENAGFARQVAAAGLVFIGPNPEAIDAMGDKIQSKLFAARADISIVPRPHRRNRRHPPRRQDLRGDRLSGDDQGLRRRRRQRHPRRLEHSETWRRGSPP